MNSEPLDRNETPDRQSLDFLWSLAPHESAPTDPFEERDAGVGVVIPLMALVVMLSIFLS